MAHHGWQGDPPATEGLARARIIGAATRCIDRVGVAKTTLSDIAADARVTRQTVYRYFPSLGELLRAVAEAGAIDFTDRMRTHLTPCPAPIDAVVEAIVFCLEELPQEPSIGILLQAEDEDLFGRGITSSTGLDLGAQFLRSLPVDWEANGIIDGDLEGLAELMLRLIGSLMQHPPATPRSPDEVRAYLRRWLGAALTAPRA
ncbi:TetR family transcriptional regulator [Aeromicrobium sp. A1-2]|uniref:TetR/AcrR family transcriptional regulator n=1 Tax=Aeromicrobium sp. A1-2 TaxID=2107713 RepID=UPI000E544859|nr:TetR/AcrR family transcriptional regulator [Aeromicrobium sp. A1-2]AXT84288.1 TetR family transcriptional regulator [Aeromicrobium sp. A1-2]